MRGRSARDRLWRDLRDLFEDDDGSLPEIQLLDVASAADADGAYRAFLRVAAPLRPTQTAWDPNREREVSLGNFPDAGLLAAFGIIEGLHVVLFDVFYRGIALPDLGVRVDRGGTISVDYRPGPHWNADMLAGFIELLGNIRALTPGTRLVAADPSGAPYSDEIQHRFSSAVEAYVASA